MTDTTKPDDAATQREPRPRWKCPSCGSTNVQISLPTWYRETDDYALEMVDTDSEADISYWFCEDCDSSESGEPDENIPDEDDEDEEDDNGN
jgi:rubrerythrin